MVISGPRVKLTLAIHPFIHEPGDPHECARARAELADMASEVRVVFRAGVSAEGGLTGLG